MAKTLTFEVTDMQYEILRIVAKSQKENPEEYARNATLGTMRPCLEDEKIVAKLLPVGKHWC